MEPLILVTIFISFFATFLAVPIWIRKARLMGHVWEDMNKWDSPKNVAGSGGIVVLFGAGLGILLYIALNTFYFKNTTSLIEILALLNVLLFASFVGVIDDILGWKKGGLSRKSRIFIVLFSAIPLMVINAGTSTVSLPFVGAMNLGVIYPLIIIPLGILGATTTFNFLAGYNGLETAQGMILLGGMTIAAYLVGNPVISVVALYMIAALFAFFIFNKYPARVFPGDSLTYIVGAMIAGLTILGNLERIAIFFFIPYIIELGLKIRGKLNVHTFGIPNEDKSLNERYKKIYSLTHLAIRVLKKLKPSRKVYEWEVVLLVNFFQLIIVIIGLVIFF